MYIVRHTAKYEKFFNTAHDIIENSFRCRDTSKFLIVDDEEQFIESISRSLELKDFNVIAVNRGEKAIEAARNNPIDIALVDR